MTIVVSDKELTGVPVAPNHKSGELLGEALKQSDDLLNIDWLVTLNKIDHLDTPSKVRVLGFYLANHRSEQAKKRVLKKLNEIKASPAYILAVKDSVSTDMDTLADNFQKYDIETLMQVYKFLKKLPGKDKQRDEYMGKLFGYIYHRANPSFIFAKDYSRFKKMWVEFLDLVLPKRQIVNVERTTNFDGVDVSLISVSSTRDFSNIEIYELYGHFQIEELGLVDGHPVPKFKGK